jgi:hypothetical protein
MSEKPAKGVSKPKEEKKETKKEEENRQELSRVQATPTIFNLNANLVSSVQEKKENPPESKWKRDSNQENVNVPSKSKQETIQITPTPSCKIKNANFSGN